MRSQSVRFLLWQCIGSYLVDRITLPGRTLQKVIPLNKYFTVVYGADTDNSYFDLFRPH